MARVAKAAAKVAKRKPGRPQGPLTKAIARKLPMTAKAQFAIENGVRSLNPTLAAAYQKVVAAERTALKQRAVTRVMGGERGASAWNVFVAENSTGFGGIPALKAKYAKLSEGQKAALKSRGATRARPVRGLYSLMFKKLAPKIAGQPVGQKGRIVSAAIAKMTQAQKTALAPEAETLYLLRRARRAARADRPKRVSGYTKFIAARKAAFQEGRPAPEVMKQLAAEWKDLSPAARAKYVSKK